jgi:hypothetical protein
MERELPKRLASRQLVTVMLEDKTLNHEGHEGSRRAFFVAFPSCDFVSFVVTESGCVAMSTAASQHFELPILRRGEGKVVCFWIQRHRIQ